MNEKPKSYWKKSGGWRGYFVFGPLIGGVLFVVILLAGLMPKYPAAAIVIGCLLLGVFAVCLVDFIRWVFCWRNFKRFLFGVICFITLIALLYAEENWRAKHEWEKFKHEWEAKGEQFEYSKIVPPPVPDDQNFAMTPLVVDSIKFQYGSNVTKQWYGVALTESERTNLVNRLMFPIYDDNNREGRPDGGRWNQAVKTDLSAWQSYYRTLATQTNLFPVATQPQSPAQDVLLGLGKYDPAVEELRAASKLPYSRFPVFSDADNPFETLLPHLGALKSSAQYFQLRACAELQDGESEKALVDTKLAVELGEKIRNEPFIISHLVRIAMLQLALQPVYEGLADHRWSDRQLVELDATLAKLDYLKDYETSMRGERAACISALEYLRRTRDMGMLQQINPKPPKMDWARLLIPDAFFTQNILTIARIQQDDILPIVASGHFVSPAEVRRLQVVIDGELNNHWSPYKIFARMLLPAVKNTGQKYVQAQASVNLGRVAIALERYRLAHGEFPESLAVLAPQFIAQVLQDVIGGQPLKYRREADGQFVLYSVGWNEKDDGGMVVFKKGSTPDVNPNQGDWVWRYPRVIEEL